MRNGSTTAAARNPVRPYPRLSDIYAEPVQGSQAPLPTGCPSRKMKSGRRSVAQTHPNPAPIMGTTEGLTPSGQGPECAGCQKPIRERYLLKALDQLWHEDCLKCACCDCRLGEVGSTLFTKANLILCKRDYLGLFGATGLCSACNKAIPAFEMVMRARGNVYHLECFACQQCNHRFCVGDRFYLHENRILCEYDYEERMVFSSMVGPPPGHYGPPPPQAPSPYNTPPHSHSGMPPIMPSQTSQNPPTLNPHQSKRPTGTPGASNQPEGDILFVENTSHK